MSLAGEIFQTRIAVGLAIPSPQAMQKAGSVLAQGIENIHGMISQRARRGQLGDYKGDLDRLNSMTLNSTTRLQNEMAVRLKKKLGEMNTAGKNTLNDSIKDTSKEWGKMSANMGAGQKDFFGASGIENQALEFGKLRADQQQDLIRNAVELRDVAEQEVQAIDDKITNMGPLKKEQQWWVTEQQKRRGKLEKEIQNYDKILKRLKLMENAWSRIQQQMQRAGERTRQFREGLLTVTDTVRSAFNKALRNSLFLLTAIGYKLNQHTQELISFERELLNANSVFNLTNTTLFDVGNTMLEFGNRFGITVTNAAQGLYQLASAGVSANDALKILPETLKLSMAVQGDHNTISKLTAQTLFGFGMEMNQAAEITDKFAYAIQKSLIEYQDLSSAVKFALPFFTSTGQSIDQLLGALQVLTNRALEAGIAGRGLRQALAEFAEGAMDAESGFRRMGVEILNSRGEMLQLSEIAEQFAAAVGPDTMSNTELLTTLIEDLNVRGATAFIHLVQASDEFTAAVEATATASGSLDEMVKIQNESLEAQIQILKTSVFSIFAYRDASYEGTEFINGFHEAVVNLVKSFKALFIEETENGQQLTKLGQQLQDFATGAIVSITEFVEKRAIPAFKDLMATGFFSKDTFDLLLGPLKVFANIIRWLTEHQTVAKVYGYLLLFSFLGLGKMLSGFIKMGRGLKEIFGWIAKNSVFKSLIKMGKSVFASSPTSGKMAVGAVAKKAAPKVASRGMLGALGPWGWALAAGLTAVDIAEWATGYDVPLLASGGYTHMAAGGSVGGKPYIVGEQGPELFVPNGAGEVLNNAQTNDILGGTSFRNVTIGIDSFGGLA